MWRRARYVLCGNSKLRLPSITIREKGIFMMTRTKALISIVFGMVLSRSAFAASGTYKVPAGQYLENDVFLKSPKADLKANSDGTYDLDYKLPRELDGVEPRLIEFRSVSAAEPLTMRANEGVANCEIINRDMSCFIRYFKDDETGVFQLNTESANAYMEARNFSPERMELMGKAQMSIMHEAAGALSFRRR